MKKRTPSPAQLRARAKFAAMAKVRAKKGRRGKDTLGIGMKKWRAGLGRNQPNPRLREAFQIAAVKGSTVLYLSGIGLSSNRSTASNYGTLSTARKIARQVRDVGRKLGIGRVAVVTSHDSPQAIRSFLLGEARRAAGKIR